MATINLVITSKGGCGKSLIATLLGQYLLEKKGAILGFDTDLHNDTFAQYKALGVNHLHLFDDQTKEVLTVGLDMLIEASIANPDADIVIDTGASSFAAVSQYFMDMDLATVWSDMGHRVNFHIPVSGGIMYSDTLAAFGLMMEQGITGKKGKCIVWCNSHFGALEGGGIHFENSAEYEKHSKKVSAMILCPRFNTLFSGTFSHIFSERLIFSEVNDSTKLSGQEKMRLPKLRNEWYGAISLADKFIL